VPATIARWAAFNRCAATPQVAREPERDARDGTRVRRERYEGCRAGAEVVLLAVEGGGHTWPNGQAYMPERVVGRVSRELDAAETIWEFCRRHAIPASN
jgi:polyhydroxybutyrate depolymerase